MDLELIDAATPSLRTGFAALAGAWLTSLSSVNTRAAYRRDLRDFAAFCDGHDLEVLAAARPAIDVYVRSLEGQGKAPATVARRLSALSSFFDYAIDAGVLPTSPVERVRRPRVHPDSPMLGLDRDEAVAVLAAAEVASPADNALITLLLLNGLRVSEAITVDVNDLDTERGHRILRVTGKGGHKRVAPLAPRTIAAIDSAIGDRTLGSIICDDQGAPINRHHAATIVRRIARSAGVNKRLSPHSLRHTMVTLALDAGVPIHVVQDAAGHRSPETTRRYDRARHQLDGHATYTLAQHLLGS